MTDINNVAERLNLMAEETPGSGAIKRAQILIRRKMNTQWESHTDVIPEGEPCFSYDSITGDYIVKVGAKDAQGNL